MKLFLILSFLVLSDADWIFRGEIAPYKRGSLTGKGQEKGSSFGPFQSTGGKIAELQEAVDALAGRVGEIEQVMEGLVSTGDGLEDGSENPDATPDPSAEKRRPIAINPSDRTAVRELLQQLESRMNEKK